MHIARSPLSLHFGNDIFQSDKYTNKLWLDGWFDGIVTVYYIIFEMTEKQTKVMGWKLKSESQSKMSCQYIYE